MKVSKHALVSLAIGVFLLASPFLVHFSTSVGEYDPWMDTNDDGRIDMRDIGNLARMFGAEGTPINKTELLLELQARIDALNATVMALQGGCVAETGEFDGVVNADMVEDSGANTVINFQNPFTSVEKPEMVINVVLKYAADGLTEGSAIKVVEDVKGAAGNWYGFDLTVSKYSGGSITDGTHVYVTWMAIGTGNTSTPQAYADITDTSTIGRQVTITYPSAFSTAPMLSASVYIKSGAYAGNMAFIVAKTIGTTSFTLDLQGWTGYAFQDIADAVNVQVSWTAVEQP